MATTSTTVPKTQIDAAMLDALFRQRFQGADYAKWVMTAETFSALARQSNLSKDQMVDLVRRFQLNYDRTVTRGETDEYVDAREFRNNVMTWLDIGAQLSLSVGAGVSVGASPIGMLRSALQRWWSDPDAREWEAEAQITAQDLQYGNYAYVNQNRQQIFTDFARILADKKGLDSFEEIFSVALDATPDQLTAPQIIDRNPQIPVPPRIRQSIKADGSCTITALDLTEMRGSIEAQFGELNTLAQKQLEVLGQITLAQKDIKQWIMDEPKRQEAEQRARDLAAAHTPVLEAASSSVFVISTLIGFADPKLGKQVSVIGEASIQIVGSTMKFFQKISVLEVAGKLTALEQGLAGAVLTGNILGAALSIATLFIDTGPTPEQMILDEIARLQQQVAQLYQTMQDRFDRIDRALGQIFEQLVEGFSQIDARLWNQEVQIRRIQIQLTAVNEDVRRLQVNLEFLLQVSGRRDLLEAINGAIPLIGGQMPENTFRTDYENKFHTWATINAKDDIEAGYRTRNYDDSRVYVELTGVVGGTAGSLPKSVDSNINYLATWLARKQGGLTFAPIPLPNPATWALSARAYAELMFGWPQLAAALIGETGRGRQEAVREEGEALLRGFRAISNVDGAAGSQPNHQLFDTLITQYTTSVALLEQTLRQVEDLEVKDIKATNGAYNEQVLQQRAMAGPLARAVADNDPASFLPAPANAATFVPRDFLIADAVQLATPGLSLQYGAAWVNYVRRFNTKLGILIQSAQLQATLTFRFEGAPLLTLQTLSPTITDSGEPEFALGPVGFGDPHEELRNNWDTGFKLKATFEAQIRQPGAVPQPQLDAMAERVGRRLVAVHLPEIYEQFATEPGLNAALDRVAGAKELLRQFAILGLPRSLREDEYLSGLLFGTYLEGGDPFHLPGEPILFGPALPGRNDIEDTYRWALSRPAMDSVNPWPSLKAHADERAEELRTGIAAHLDAKVGQEWPFIEDTLRRLRIAEVHTLPRPGSALIAGQDAVVRQGPAQAAAVQRKLTQGQRYATDGFTDFGDMVAGTAQWFHLASGGWVHASNGRYLPPGVTEPDLKFVSQPGKGPAAPWALRRQQPSTDAPERQPALGPGRVYAYDGYTDDGQSVDGSTRWFRLSEQAGGGWVPANGFLPTDQSGLQRLSGTFTAERGATRRREPKKDAPKKEPALQSGKSYAVNGYRNDGDVVGGSKLWYRLEAGAGGGWVHSSQGRYRPRPAVASSQGLELESEPEAIGREAIFAGGAAEDVAPPQ